TEDSEAARNNYRKAFQISPDSPAVLAAFIDALIQAGDADEACTVLATAPRTPANLEKLAWFYIRRQEFGRAVSTYEALLEHAPQNTDILKRLAALHQKLGHSHRAIDCLAKARAS
ncbi:MAG: tetratricopeptide repeat protein, partial [Calditrichaeota bacterium]|nr:tetratricopeptide repeat protein [Calditrichota bacterium]